MREEALRAGEDIEGKRRAEGESRTHRMRNRCGSIRLLPSPRARLAAAGLWSQAAGGAHHPDAAPRCAPSAAAGRHNHPAARRGVGTMHQLCRAAPSMAAAPPAAQCSGQWALRCPARLRRRRRRCGRRRRRGRALRCGRPVRSTRPLQVAGAPCGLLCACRPCVTSRSRPARCGTGTRASGSRASLTAR